MSRIITSIIIFLGLLAIIFIGIIQKTYQENTKFTNMIFDRAKETLDFDDFLAYQVDYFKKIDETSNANYQISIYQLVLLEEDNYKNSLIVFLIPIGEVMMADSKDDPNDFSNIIIKDHNEVIFDSYYFNDAFSLTYGLNEEVMGFIYQTIDIDNDDTYNILIKNYEGNPIYENDSLVNIIDNQESLHNFNKGWTIDEISKKMDLTNKLIGQSFIYSLVYLLIIFTGFGIYKIYKRTKS